MVKSSTSEVSQPFCFVLEKYRIATLKYITDSFSSAAKLACQHDIEGMCTFCPDFTLFGRRTLGNGEQVSFLLL